MKHIKTREEFINESDDALNENAEVDVNIAVEDDAEDMIEVIDKVDGVKKAEPTKFGIVKARVVRKVIDTLKKLAGVENVSEVPNHK